jgi:hypothetical protein
MVLHLDKAQQGAPEACYRWEKRWNDTFGAAGMFSKQNPQRNISKIVMGQNTFASLQA